MKVLRELEISVGIRAGKAAFSWSSTRARKAAFSWSSNRAGKV